MREEGRCNSNFCGSIRCSLAVGGKLLAKNIRYQGGALSENNATWKLLEYSGRCLIMNY